MSPFPPDEALSVPLAGQQLEHSRATLSVVFGQSGLYPILELDLPLEVRLFGRVDVIGKHGFVSDYRLFGNLFPTLIPRSVLVSFYKVVRINGVVVDVPYPFGCGVESGFRVPYLT